MAKILVGITGSIAAYKSLELIRLFRRDQHEVKVVLTSKAQDFITKTSILAFGAEVYNDTYESSNSIMQHISLAKWPDVIVIMPLSANSLSKITYGMGDNLLNTTLLATKATTFLVPAMNMDMWSNSIIQEHVIKLYQHGFKFIGPVSGLQACGDNGVGRMVEASEVYKYIKHFMISLQYPKIDLKNKKIVITLGGTIEKIDPVRYIANNSSGKMGLELAYACVGYGANVTIISANVSVDLPESINIINVSSADEMFNTASHHVSDADIFISCAAVADYKIVNYHENKIKKSDDDKITMNLVKNIDILSAVRKLFKNLFIVGFAAETENLIEHAKNKLRNKRLDLIIANDIKNNKIFANDDTKVSIINKFGNIKDIANDTKMKIAHEIILEICSAIAYIPIVN